MGLFGTNYAKPGRGVGKDDPQKRRFFVFWEIFARKFGSLELVNLLFVLMCLVIFGLFLLANSLIMDATKNGLLINFVSFLPLVLLAFPITGMTYITRNFVREEHAFTAYDFFRQMWVNRKLCLKQGLAMYFAGFTIVFALTYYFNNLEKNPFFVIPGLMCTLVMIFFVFTQFYIFPMIVTFDMPFRKIVKNGVIFAVIGAFRNLFLLILMGILLGFIAVFFFSMEIALIGIVLLFCGIPAFCSYLSNSITYPLIVKYLLKPSVEQTPKTEEITQQAQESGAEKSEYIFENGRLIKRMDSVEQIFEDKK